jgi:hypothetical protein
MVWMRIHSRWIGTETWAVEDYLWGMETVETWLQTMPVEAISFDYQIRHHISSDFDQAPMPVLSMSVLPSFLEPWDKPDTIHLPYKNAYLNTNRPSDPSMHCGGPASKLTTVLTPYFSSSLVNNLWNIGANSEQ